MSRNFIRAVLFDLGGTLMYERESWHTVNARADEALTNYLRGQGLELNLSTFPIEFRRRLDEYFNQREKNLLETTYSSVLRIEIVSDHHCFGRQEIPVGERQFKNARMWFSITTGGRCEDEIKEPRDAKAARQLLDVLVITGIRNQPKTISILFEFFQGWQCIVFQQPVFLSYGKQTIQRAS